MTATHVALFRGMNVGKANRIAMADLAAVFAGLGCTQVKTLLASGNVAFAPPAGAPGRAFDAARLETALAAGHAVRCRVTLLSAVELVAILDANPLAEAARREPTRFLVAVLREPSAGSALRPLLARDWGPERLAVGPRAAYLHCPAGISGGRLATDVDRALGDRVTARNAATMEKLRALVSPSGAVGARPTTRRRP